MNNVINGTMAHDPFTGTTEQEARQNAQNEFDWQIILEINRSEDAVFSYPGAVRCALEEEAKIAVGATHKGKRQCLALIRFVHKV